MKMNRVELTLLGSPPRKSNRRVWTGKQLIKSREAIRYAASVQGQVPSKARQRLSGPIQFTAHIYYDNPQSDLSAELIMDALQDQYALVPSGEGLTPTGRPKKKRVLLREGVYRDDNQIAVIALYKHLDRENPRAEIIIEEVEYA